MFRVTDRTRICRAAHCPDSTVYAAEELSRFIGEMSGYTPEIAAEGPRPGDIAVGQGLSAPAGICERIPYNSDRVIIRELGGVLYVYGGEPRGTLYAVYTLLTDVWDCRWLTPDCSVIPENKNLTVAADIDFTPTIACRDGNYAVKSDPVWVARNRANGPVVTSQGREPRFGAPYLGNKGGHSFERFVPNELFAEHPEYFSYNPRVGKRQLTRTQLCLTNEDVFSLVLKGIFGDLERNPGQQVVAVCQNDPPQCPCRCERCMEVANEAGSYAELNLRFVNRLADEVAKRYPNVKLSTYAYWYSRHTPKTKPRDNVIIELCSIECCFSHPFEGDSDLRPTCKDDTPDSFDADLYNWGRLCTADNLFIYDYCHVYRILLNPFPNLHTLKPNMKLYARNGVAGVFHDDGAVYNLRSEMDPLRCYLSFQLMWNCDYDDRGLRDRFCEGYFGPGWRKVAAYIDMIAEHVVKNNLHVSMAEIHFPHITKEMAAEGIRLLGEAAELAQTDEQRDRIERERLSPRYVYTCMMFGGEGYKEMVDSLFDDIRRLDYPRISCYRTLEESYDYMIKDGWGYCEPPASQIKVED